MRDPEGFARWQLRILAALGVNLPPGASVLDFGCGDGAVVRSFLGQGFDAYGCDIEVPVEAEDHGRLLAISKDPYRLPFDGGRFDFVFSSEVFEHVSDHASALREIRRVLRPAGVSIHVFPTKYTLVEPHTFVPLASVVRDPLWLRLWAAIGIRNRYQRDLRAEEVVRANLRYLATETHYLSRREFRAIAREWFETVIFIEHVAIPLSTRRVRLPASVVKLLPPLASLYGTVWSSMILLA